jgi:hypothetical protein
MALFLEGPVSFIPNVYVSDQNQNQILKYTAWNNTWQVLVPPGVGGLSSPCSLLLGTDHDKSRFPGKDPGDELFILVANFGTGSILKFNIDGKFLGELIPPVSSGGPMGLAWGGSYPNWELYVSVVFGPNILRYSYPSGSFLGTLVPVVAGGLNQPGTLIISGNNLYVCDNQQVLLYDATTGALIKVLVTVGSGGLEACGGMAFGPDRNLYITDNTRNSVLRYDGTTGAFLDVFIPANGGGLLGGSALAFDSSDGGLYIANFYAGNVLRFNGKTGAFVDAVIPSNGTTPP